MILLLGAGFARGYGLPLMSEMLPRFKRQLASEGEEPKRLLGVLEYLEDIDGRSDPSRIHNIESVLHVADVLRSLDPVIKIAYGSDPRDTPAPDLIDELASRMRQFIKRSCILPEALPEWLKSLIPLFKQQGPTWIFTTNYDAGLEVLCEREDIEVIDGFNPSWNPGLFDEPMQDETAKKAVYLVKLHGSVLWYQPDQEWKPLKLPVYEPESDLRYFDGRLLRNEPMIYPARTKDTSAQPFASLVELFRRKLRDETICVAVGYSFADAYLRRIFAEELHVSRAP